MRQLKREYTIEDRTITGEHSSENPIWCVNIGGYLFLGQSWGYDYYVLLCPPALLIVLRRAHAPHIDDRTIKDRTIEGHTIEYSLLRIAL